MEKHVPALYLAAEMRSARVISMRGRFVTQDDQHAFWRPGVVLCDRFDPFSFPFTPWMQPCSGSFWRAISSSFTVFIPPSCNLGEDAASLDRLMLPGVTDQENVVVRVQAPQKLMHLLGEGQRTFVHDIETMVAGISLVATGKMFLQS